MSTAGFDLGAFQRASIAAVERDLQSVVAVLAVPEVLRDAVSYALLGGGKRLRPVLSLLCFASVRGDTALSPAEGLDAARAIVCAGAVEMVHAFSLVHDDLPALDNDDLRRGRPTLHVHAGEAMAVLAGDLLLSLAYQQLCERIDDAELGRALTRDLASATMGMIGGQVLDTIGASRPAAQGPASVLESIHRGKTGALVRASAVMGARVGLWRVRGESGTEDRLSAVGRFADALGLMFQIIDDLIDVERSSSEAGKRTGKDLELGKLTYPGVHGVGRSRRMVGELLDEACDAANEATAGGRGLEGLRAMARWLASRQQ